MVNLLGMYGKLLLGMYGKLLLGMYDQQVSFSRWHEPRI